jgi:hypothetical protein
MHLGFQKPKNTLLLGWFKALRWQRLPEMDGLGDFLLRHLDGIARCIQVGEDA